MAITNNGLKTIINIISGITTGSNLVYNTTNGYVGIGDGSVSFLPTQTTLQGTNQYRTKFTTVGTSQNILTIIANFGENEANFTWQEWGLFNASTGGTMLNRVVQNNGTKTVGQTWAMTITITLNIT